MPSPFPGMDPYLEGNQLWPVFQQGLVRCLYQLLQPGLMDRYRERVNQRHYVTEQALFTSIIREEHEEEFIEIRQRGDGRVERADWSRVFGFLVRSWLCFAPGVCAVWQVRQVRAGWCGLPIWQVALIFRFLNWGVWRPGLRLGGGGADSGARSGCGSRRVARLGAGAEWALWFVILYWGRVCAS